MKLTYIFQNPNQANSFLSAAEKEFHDLIPRHPYVNNGSPTLDTSRVIIPGIKPFYMNSYREKADKLAGSFNGIRIE